MIAEFRAWHKAEKIMGTVEVLTIGQGAFVTGVKPDLSSQVVEVGHVLMTPVPPTHGRFCSLEDIELLQFTGLLDKNGTKVFEGDIVKTNFKTGEVIRYCEWNFTAVGFMFGGWHYTSEDMALTEVIGNIYQNSELLKGKS